MLAPTILPPAAAAPVELISSFKDTDRFSLKSRSSSFSQSSQSSHGSLSSRKFQHHYEPTVLDRPDAVDAIRDALLVSNDALLADLVSLYGLPPSLRASAWPVLLRSHPYVINALKNYPEPLSATEIPVKRIRGDLKRFRRYRGPGLLEDTIFNTVHDFLLQWGSVIPYETAMIWVADFLVSGDLPYNHWSGERSAPTSSTASSVDLSSPISPTRSTASSNETTHAAVAAASSSSGPPDDDYCYTSQAFTGVSCDQLGEVFTHIMLVMNHTPAEFSDFISTVRNRLPTLSRHFECEGMLYSASGGDDWLIWWLKWLGIRAFTPTTMSRLWDSYFSIREGQQLVSHMHLFNCILLIKENFAKIMELDQSECREFLMHLPSSKDVEAIIVEGRALAAQTSGEEDKEGEIRVYDRIS